jgi:hypothetical protein
VAATKTEAVLETVIDTAQTVALTAYVVLVVYKIGLHDGANITPTTERDG